MAAISDPVIYPFSSIAFSRVKGQEFFVRRTMLKLKCERKSASDIKLEYASLHIFFCFSHSVTSLGDRLVVSICRKIPGFYIPSNCESIPPKFAFLFTVSHRGEAGENIYLVFVAI